MENILILVSENPRSALAIIRELQKNKAYNIVLGFNVEFAGNIKIWEKFSKFPSEFYDSSSFDRFKASLRNISEKFEKITILPMGEKTTQFLTLLRNDFQSMGLYCVVPNNEAFNILSDKDSFQETMKSYGFTVPSKPYARQDDIFRSKFVVKPKDSTKHESLDEPLLILNRRGFDRFKSLKLDDDNLIFQEYIDGASIYVCGYFNGNEIVDLFCQENLSQQPGGKSILKAIPIDIPSDLSDKIKTMLQDLSYVGIFMFEFIVDDKCNFVAIECNSRIWGPIQLAQDNGIALIHNLTQNCIPSQLIRGKKSGYIWINGYFTGLFYALKYKQWFKTKKSKFAQGKFKYRDVYLRKDSWKLFISEIFDLTIFRILKREHNE